MSYSAYNVSSCDMFWKASCGMSPSRRFLEILNTCIAVFVFMINCAGNWPTNRLSLKSLWWNNRYNNLFNAMVMYH